MGAGASGREAMIGILIWWAEEKRRWE